MPMTVLIVDDHPSFRATARALLEAEGYDVVGEADDGAAALAVGALTVLIILQSNHDDQRVVTAVLGPLVGWSFIAAGLVAWSRRPANHTGRLMVALGFAWALTALTEANDKWIYSTGLAVGAIFL